MERGTQGGSDVGRDIERDLGDEPPPTIRDTRARLPGARSTRRAPVSGHVPPPESRHRDRRVARARLGTRQRAVFPAFRPVGTQGLAVESFDRDTLAAHAAQSHAQPLLDQGRRGCRSSTRWMPARFDIVVNGDHLLSWGVEPSDDPGRGAWPTWRLVGDARLDRRDLGRTAGWSARRPATAGMPRGSCCPRSSRTSTTELGSVRPDPHRDPGAAPPDGRLAAPRRRGIRGALRGLHRRAVGRRGRADRPARLRARRRTPRRIRRGLTPRPDGRGAGDPAFTTIRFEVADAIATITLDRPDALNALTVPMKGELLAAFRAIARDRAVRAVVLTGAGPGVLCRPGPQGAARARRRPARGRGPRALQPDHPRDARARPADRRGDQRGRGRRRRVAGVRLRHPDRGRGRELRARVRPDRARARQRRDVVPAAPRRPGEGRRAGAPRRFAVGGRCRAVRARRAGGRRRTRSRPRRGRSPRGWPRSRRGPSRRPSGRCSGAGRSTSTRRSRTRRTARASPARRPTTPRGSPRSSRSGRRGSPGSRPPLPRLDVGLSGRDRSPARLTIVS